MGRTSEVGVQEEVGIWGFEQTAGCYIPFWSGWSRRADFDAGDLAPEASGSNRDWGRASTLAICGTSEVEARE